MLLSLASLHATAAPSPWQKLAPTMFEHLVPAERGFPSPVTMSLAQDGDGFLWFGTQAGLGRWDGYRMRNFFHHADDPHSLPGDFVQTMHVDRQGRLWLGTSTNGVAMYDKRSETFIRYPAGPNGLSSPAVSALASDAGGGIWVGTAAGLDYIDVAHGGAIRHYPRAADAAGGPRSNQIRALLSDADGSLWIGSNAGLARRGVSGKVSDLPDRRCRRRGAVAGAAYRPGQVLFGTLKSGIGIANEDGAHLLALDQVKDAAGAMVLSISPDLAPASGGQPPMAAA